MKALSCLPRPGFLVPAIVVVVALTWTSVGSSAAPDAGSPRSPIVGTIPDTERDALIAFYHSLNGEEWRRDDGWLGPPGTECGWEGVTCNEDWNAVTKLVFNYNNLSGRLPAELGSLSALKELVLQYNDRVSGPLPDELAALSHLEVLEVIGSEYFLGTAIPAWLGGLSNLRELRLEGFVEGGIPSELGNLTNLEVLQLNCCGVSGAIPSTLGSLGRLRVLSLGDGLTGSIPPQLGDLENLEVLRLSWSGGYCNGQNLLTGSIPPELGRLSKLRLLALWGNDLTGRLPAELGNLTELETLDLHGNSLSGPMPEELGNLTKLVALDLFSNNLEGPLPRELGNLTKLEVLNLRGNSIDGEIPDELGNLTSLRVLWVDGDLSGSIPAQLGQLVELESLWLTGSLTGALPDELANLLNLWSLRLSGNRLQGPLPPWIGGLSELGALYLDDNRLEGPIPAEIGNCINLDRLMLQGNRLRGSIPESIQNLQTHPVYDWFDLRWNALSTEDDAVRRFVNGRQLGGDFEATQTVPPKGVAAAPQGPDSVLVSWTPVHYTASEGYYRVLVSSSPGGSFDLAVETRDKTVSSATIGGLVSDQTHYFQIETVTLAHTDNQSAVVSEPSSTVSSATASQDSPGRIEFSSTAYRASEGEHKLVRVRRLGGIGGVVTVGYTIQPGTATQGTDYVGDGGTLTWPAGDGDDRTVVLDIVSDSLLEGEESLGVTLTNPGGGASLGSPQQATVVIRDRDLKGDEEGEPSSAGHWPAVAVDALGRRVVVWSHVDPLTGGRRLLAQLYDADGSPSGSQFAVSPNGTGDQHSAAVASDAGGRFVVTWQSETATMAKGSRPKADAANGIFGRMFDAGGAPLGDQFVIDDGSLGWVSSPALAVEPSGRFVVVWKRASPSAAGRTTNKLGIAGIVGRYFDASGLPQGGSVPLADPALGEAHSPALAVDSNGGVVVAWERKGSDEWRDVVARLFDGRLEPAGTEVVMNTDTWHDQGAPQVAVADGSGYLVTWHGPSLPLDEEGDRPAGTDVYVRLLAQSGEPDDEVFRVNATLTGSQRNPAVAGDGEGNCWVTWEQEHDSGLVGAFGRYLPGCATPPKQLLPEIRLDTPDVDSSVRSVSVGLDPQGDLTSVWARDDLQEGDGGIVGRALYADQPGTECTPDETTLCLRGNRFEVKVEWLDFAGSSGSGYAVPLSSDTGYFWFFDDTNVELVLKVLDGTAINGSYWVYYGALSNVEYTISVRDAETGATATYANPMGEFASAGDTGALPGGGRSATVGRYTRWAPVPMRGGGGLNGTRTLPNADCTPGRNHLCLNDGRFKVVVTWRDFEDHTGFGEAEPVSGDTGYFWFFDESNVELIAKVLDGRGINGHFWVYYGALSNVEYTVFVTDMVTGAVKTYTNPLGGFGSMGDSEAFHVP